ncbi:hypothetical protein SAMN05660420_02470 [Desulfuromusa kysingii]|uniref:Nicotinamide riboside transporter PnuC n=1 Tax=Desulfuromusa kysingii TaxID=37625 RepID=A0A1H4C7K5_9BACT|nr:hypothetical protein [Desulfuromusa kysingii]SEA56293.1 hypothetical protein SAMN05660420_02470 [Desulfuromusa kysingii]
MDLILQVWGGLFYLLSKVFFALAEGKKYNKKRRLRIIGWSVYMMGVPAWTVLYIGSHSWIAASIEVGSLPTMYLGLYASIKGPDATSKTFSRVITYSTYLFLVFGISCSLYDFGGLHSFSQFLELTILFTFFVGSSLLAKDNLNGWVCFILMNGSIALLMMIQGKRLLVFQQILSLCFVVYGFIVAEKMSKPDASKPKKV